MTPSLSIAGLHAVEGPWSAGPREAIDWAASLGFSSVHLDAAAPGLRARDLDRSARRDLAATLRRNDLGFTGLDLWIPAEHYAEPATADRAAGALLGAIELASELNALCGGGLAVISTMLPEEAPESLTHAIAAKADQAGVAVEDFTPRETPTGLADTIRPGFDTAREIMRGGKPNKAFSRVASSLATLRLNDADDTGRKALGKGRVEVAMIRALHETLAASTPVVTDLRGLADPAAGARAALDAWG
ncbi:MAG: hypothetical protein H6810_02695 [Phycisphaeraceae bacterium]|nr:MAG: hypothetical protein H6810_02695 [Phycisphaeraceae bacterium]